ncbi:MAG: hypothetical protein ACXQTC_04555, partial [Methanopyraceae archaeon]
MARTPPPGSRRLDSFITSPPEGEGRKGEREEEDREPSPSLEVKTADGDVYYSSLAEAFERLERLSSRKAKIALIAQFLRQCPEDVLDTVAVFLANQVFPGWDPRELGIGTKLMQRIIAKAAGVPESEVTERFKRLGDLGLVAEELLKGRRTATLLSSRPLTVGEVRETFEKIAEVEGEGAVTRKM